MAQETETSSLPNSEVNLLQMEPENSSAEVEMTSSAKSDKPSSSSHKSDSDKTDVESFTPMQRVSSFKTGFSVDHILENILGSLNVQTLKKCRLACRRWNSFAEKLLENLVKIQMQIESPRMLSDRNFEGQLIRHEYHTDSCPFLKMREQYHNNRTHVVFKSLMKNSKYLPCTDFRMNVSEFAYNQLNDTISCISIRIRKLNFFFNLYDSVPLLELQYFIRCIQALLAEHTPNLEYFKVKLFVSHDTEHEIDRWDSDRATRFFDRKYFELQHGHQSQPQTSQTHPQEGRKLLLPNLKVLKLVSHFPHKAIKEILKEAANLNKLQAVLVSRLTTPVNLWPRYFMEGDDARCRIKILKKLTIELNLSTIPFLHRFANEHRGNIHLQFLHIQLFVFQIHLIQHPQLLSRCANIINIILESSSETLREFMLCPLRLFETVQIPVMTSLKMISFEFPYVLGHGFSNFFFPVGFDMATSFPVVEIIDAGEIMRAQDFIRWLDLLRPVHSVKIVTADGLEFLTQSVRQRLASMFPNGGLGKYSSTHICYSRED